MVHFNPSIFSQSNRFTCTELHSAVHFLFFTAERIFSVIMCWKQFLLHWTGGGLLIRTFLLFLLKLLLQRRKTGYGTPFPFINSHHQYSEISPRPRYLEGNANQMKLLQQHCPSSSSSCLLVVFLSRQRAGKGTERRGLWFVFWGRRALLGFVSNLLIFTMDHLVLRMRIKKWK